jgi:hypothetical protein
MAPTFRGLGGAADAGRRRRTGSQPFIPDWLPAAHADAVASGLPSAKRRIDLGDPLPRLAAQRGRVLPLERQRGTLGVVLVVRTARSRGLGDAVEVPLQRRYPPQCPRPLRQQHVAHALHGPDATCVTPYMT